MSDSETDIQIVPNHEDERRDRLRAETLGVPVPEKADEPEPVEEPKPAEEPKATETKPKAAETKPKTETAQEPADSTK